MNREPNKAKKTEAEETRLLKKVVKKDKKAFEKLYELTSNKLFLYLYRWLQNRESAEDIHIEVYTIVWKNAERFQGKSKVTTWIFGIARNLALNELRKKYRETTSIYKPVKDENSSVDYDKFERKQYIQEALMKVSEKHREILDLVFFHEFNYSEIASLLEIPENTVKTRVYYAKAALKEKLMKMNR
jgi:RNA polymerase sigma-70 factor (ECF subfamily)